MLSCSLNVILSLYYYSVVRVLKTVVNVTIFYLEHISISGHQREWIKKSFFCRIYNHNLGLIALHVVKSFQSSQRENDIKIGVSKSIWKCIFSMLQRSKNQENTWYFRCLFYHHIVIKLYRIELNHSK